MILKDNGRRIKRRGQGLTGRWVFFQDKSDQGKDLQRTKAVRRAMGEMGPFWCVLA